MFYYNATFTAGDKYVNESTMKIPCVVNDRSNPCRETPSLSAWGIVDPLQPYFYYRIFDLKANKTFFEQYVNICSLEKQAGLKIILRLFLEQIKESSNLILECPLPMV